MSFAIEVPGEANPLTPQQVYLVLQSATSSQQQSVQTAAQQLQTWETQRGYYRLLQAAYLDQSLPSEIRYLAVIQLKNGIDKYWRKNAVNGIRLEEKAQIRSQLLQGGLNEAEGNLALHYALVTSKIVRIDYPLDWPDVLTDLISVLRTAKDSNQLHLRRGMLILHNIVKELATARLRKSQTSLQSIAPEIVYLLGEIYSQKTTQWLSFFQGSGDDEGGTMEAMENSLSAIKIIRRLLISGYEYPNHDKDVQKLWQFSQEQFGQFLSILSQQPLVLVSPAKDLVEDHLVQFAKLHLSMASDHPAAFALLPNSIELVRAYWGLITNFSEQYGSPIEDLSAEGRSKGDGTKDDRSTMEKICLKGLTLIRACIKMVFKPAQMFKYRTPEIKEEQKKGVELIKTQLFTDDLVAQMANVIVTKFFTFRQLDLEAWEEDEEEWEIREEGGGDTFDFEIRPCSERLFMDLVLNFKHLLIQPLLSFFQSVIGTNQSSLVTKDAVYTAMGLSAVVVFDSFDFNTFLTSTLVNDVQLQGNSYKVLRRRIAILIGQWIPINISEENKPIVYQIFQHFLKADDEINDTVVRITAARQLKPIVDEIEFQAQGFLPYIPGIIGPLLSLLQELQNTESKLAVLQTIGAISQRIDQHISPYADQIITILPGVWDDAGEENLIKQAILTLLATLVASTKEQSKRYHPMILPLIQRAVEPGSEMQVYLLEDALDLWTQILAQSSAPASVEVIALAESALPLLEIGSDSLRVVLSIVNSYILLAPDAMLGDVARLRVLSYMTSILGITKRDLAGLVTTVVEDMIRGAEVLGGSQGIALITKDLHESGCSDKIFEALRDAWECHQTLGPDRRAPKLDDVVETDYFTILARITLADPGALVTLMGSVGNVEEVWTWLSAEWFRHFDAMVNVDHQKLSCLALTRLLELPPMATLVLERLQDYFTMWTTVVSAMQDGREDGGDNLVWAAMEATEWDTAEDIRRRAHSCSDPVHTVHALPFIKARLQQLVQASGGEAEFQQTWAVNVDKEVLVGFQNL